MPSNQPTVCVPCRRVWRSISTCPECGGGGTTLHSSWRAPRRADDRAWKRIEAGEWWDRAAIEKKAAALAEFLGPRVPMADRRRIFTSVRRNLGTVSVIGRTVRVHCDRLDRRDEAALLTAVRRANHRAPGMKVVLVDPSMEMQGRWVKF